MRIVIVNHGSGNLRSVQKGLEKIGAMAEISDSPQALADATHLVVPGVGAFSECMQNLKQRHLLKPIGDALRAGKPYLGICLGLQILFTQGEEFGVHPGMDILSGTVIRFPNTVKAPHMGWNNIQIQQPALPIWDGIPQESFFYFVHSYYACPEESKVIAATTRHGVLFSSAVAHENIFACQFHPEKSQAVGLRLLANFAKLK